MSAPWNSAVSSITTLEVAGGPSGTALRSSGQPAAGIGAPRSSTRRDVSRTEPKAQLRGKRCWARRFEAKLHYQVGQTRVPERVCSSNRSHISQRGRATLTRGLDGRPTGDR